MALSQGKYKPSIAAIDEVDDRSLNHENLQKQQTIEGSETAPLTINQHKLNIDDNINNKDLESQKALSSAPSDTQNSGGNGSMNGFQALLLPGRRSFDALMGLPRKRRILYITTVCLCAILLLIISLMIAFWPDVPFYLKAKLCLEKECMESSQQLLLWANTSKNTCHETYEWACGNFAQEYADNEYFVIKRGEWNYKTFNEYQELNELNRFISMLPSSGNSYTVESMITSLYRSCREIDTLDKSQSDLLLKKAIKSVEGWQAFRDSNRLQNWDFKKALVHLQVIYGIFPYYKVSVENRFNTPHDYIITLDQGDLGLPDKYFYNIDQNDEIIRGYKLLLRDFAINMGIVSREAELFADEIYHYEKRIVNHLGDQESDYKSNEVKTLAELKSLAPSLPIYESLQALFPHTKITEETEALVRGPSAFQELSTVLSTSDKKPINNFIIWSLARNLLPHLSKEYRNLMETFDHAIYGRTANYPRWMICTKIVRDWIPFAVDALQQNTNLLKASQSSFDYNIYQKSSSFPNKTQGNDEFLNLVFYSVVNQLQDSVKQASWIEEQVKDFINEKLTSMRLQIGIPEEALQSKDYIKDYYNELLLNNLYFVEHLQSIWSFHKSRMEEMLKPMNIVDTIISEMYNNVHPQSISYSKNLNMLIISRGITISKYYDYRYPVAVNFARIGADILEVLTDHLTTFVEQYNADNVHDVRRFDLTQVDVACLTQNELQRHELVDLSQDARKSFHITLSAARTTARALSSFITAIDSASPIRGASMDPQLTYESLRLNERLRLPGLRSYNENELFTLAYMQKHCSSSIADKDYAKIKPYVEQQLAERYLFNACWNHIKFLPLASSCSTSSVYCAHIL